MTTVSSFINQLQQYPNLTINDAVTDQIMTHLKALHKIQQMRTRGHYIFYLNNFETYFIDWYKYSEISFKFTYQVFGRSIYIKISYKPRPGQLIIPPECNVELNHLEDAYKSKFGIFMRKCIIHEDDNPKEYLLQCFEPALLEALETNGTELKVTTDWSTDT